MKKNLVIAVSSAFLPPLSRGRHGRGAASPPVRARESTLLPSSTPPLTMRRVSTTRLVTVISRDGEYVDHGGDGTPDSPGDPVLPMEHLTARVDEVLSGDESLAGSELTVVQSELGTTSETTPEEHLVPGRKYLIIASEHEPKAPSRAPRGQRLSRARVSSLSSTAALFRRVRTSSPRRSATVWFPSQRSTRSRAARGTDLRGSRSRAATCDTGPAGSLLATSSVRVRYLQGVTESTCRVGASVRSARSLPSMTG